RQLLEIPNRRLRHLPVSSWLHVLGIENRITIGRDPSRALGREFMKPWQGEQSSRGVLVQDNFRSKFLAAGARCPLSGIADANWSASISRAGHEIRHVCNYT